MRTVPTPETVRAEVALEEPRELEAVPTTRIACETSAARRT